MMKPKGSAQAKGPPPAKSKSGARSPRSTASKGDSSPRPVAKRAAKASLKDSQANLRESRRALDKAEGPSKTEGPSSKAGVPAKAGLRPLPDTQRRPVDRSSPELTTLRESRQSPRGASDASPVVAKSVSTPVLTQSRSSTETPTKGSDAKPRADSELSKRYAELNSRHSMLVEKTPVLQQEVEQLRNEVRVAEERKETSRTTMLDRLSGLVKEMELLSEKVDAAQAQVDPNSTKLPGSNGQNSEDAQLRDLRQQVKAMEATVQEKGKFLEVVMAQVHASQRAQKEVERILQQNTATLHSLNIGVTGTYPTILVNDQDRADTSHYEIFTPQMNPSMSPASWLGETPADNPRQQSPVPGVLNHLLPPSQCNGNAAGVNTFGNYPSSINGSPMLPSVVPQFSTSPSSTAAALGSRMSPVTLQSAPRLLHSAQNVPRPSSPDSNQSQQGVPVQSTVQQYMVHSIIESMPQVKVYGYQ